MIKNNFGTFEELMRNQDWEKDIVALGYRRKQLAEFDKLLNDANYFEEKRTELNKTPEAVWQHFFEHNEWIFGYGLSYQYVSSLDDKRLEEVVRGYSVGGPGKRIDGFLKSRGALSSLCLVEIKRHDTDLLKRTEYRPGAWAPSTELTGGVAQVQSTIRAAQKEFGEQFRPTDGGGNPTGELIGIVAPTSFLVVGRLSEFDAEHGPNMQKFACFEDYRRNVQKPEIITFDELYERAAFILESA